MGVYAQTNLQLHAQLCQLGYSVDEQEYVAAAHRLAADLFSSQYRGSGKPFIAHLVGTASILASIKVSAAVVAAGLLHAAYDQGDFGLGLRGRHADKRSELRKVVGVDAEDYVQRYFGMRWTDAVIADLPAKVGALSAAEQRVVLIRLANELEDYLDAGVLFCANSAARLSRLANFAEHDLALARHLGQLGLAQELSRAFSENQSGFIPAGVQEESGHSFRRVPRSYGRRYIVVLRSHLTRLL